MNEVILDGLVELLGAQTGVGELLEGVVSVQLGRLPQALKKTPAVLIAWDKDLRSESQESGHHEHTGRFLATLVLTDLRAGLEAEKQLQHHLMRRESGVLKGLKPALWAIQGFAAPDGQRFIVRVGETRRQDQPDGFASVAAVTEIFVTTWL